MKPSIVVRKCQPAKGAQKMPDSMVVIDAEDNRSEVFIKISMDPNMRVLSDPCRPQQQPKLKNPKILQVQIMMANVIMDKIQW